MGRFNLRIPCLHYELGSPPVPTFSKENMLPQHKKQRQHDTRLWGCLKFGGGVLGVADFYSNGLGQPF